MVTGEQSPLDGGLMEHTSTVPLFINYETQITTVRNLYGLVEVNLIKNSGIMYSLVRTNKSFAPKEILIRHNRTVLFGRGYSNHIHGKLFLISDQTFGRWLNQVV